MKKKFTLLSLMAMGSFAQGISAIPFAGDFDAATEITNAGDARLFVAQQDGKIKIVNPDGTVNADDFLSLTTETIATGGEHGLLGLAFHPQHAANGLFYVCYTRAGDSAITVAQYSASPENANIALPSSGIPILTVTSEFSAMHNGGTLRFGPDGYLYIAVGDDHYDTNSQDIDNNLGKILRIDVDHPNGIVPYSIPASNPFVGIDGNDEIWATGLRNPWKFSFDRNTGDLWIADVGNDLNEEINHVSSALPGLNYGWPCYEGYSTYLTCETSPTAFTYPQAQYLHGPNHCSITGGYVYTGALYPAMLNKYFFSDFCGNSIGMMDTVTGEISYSQVFEDWNYITTLGEGADGELYIIPSGLRTIFKIFDANLGVASFAKNGFSIAPNPASNEFFVKLANDNFPAEVSIIDLSGKVLLEQSVNSSNGAIATDQLQNGIYIVSIKDRSGAVSNAKLAVAQ